MLIAPGPTRRFFASPKDNTSRRDCPRGNDYCSVAWEEAFLIRINKGEAPMDISSHPPGQGKPKLLDRVRAELRKRHYSPRTEEAYLSWIARYIRFHRMRHPAEMAKSEVEAFLSSLAVDHNVAASTQNQALAAPLFLHREIGRA